MEARGRSTAYTNAQFKNDLKLLKRRFIKSTGPVRDKVQNLIESCLNLTQGVEDAEPPEELNDSFSFIRKRKKVRRKKRFKPGNGSENPLENPLILKNILSHLPRKSLLRSRFVNRSWNTQTVSLIQKKMMKDYPSQPIDLYALSEDFENSDFLLLTALSIELQDLFLSDFSKFFPKHGSQIKKLEIRDDSDSKWNPETPEILRQIFQHVLNLKELFLGLYSRSELVYEEFMFDELEISEINLPRVKNLDLDCSSSWMSKGFLNGLFSIMPNINEISLWTWNDGDSEGFIEALRKLNLQTLRCTSLISDTPDLYRRLAKDNTTRLKNLEMRIDPRFLESQQELLTNQAKTLEFLSLTILQSIEFPDGPKLQLPVMKKLKNVKFNTPWGFGNQYTVPFNVFPIEAEQLPNIRTIFIEPAMIQMGVLSNNVFKSVKHLCLPCSALESSHLQVLPQIKHQFPNLKKLDNFQTHLDASTMSLIVDHLDNIEELELKVVGDYELMQNFNLVISGVPSGNGWALWQLATLMGVDALTLIEQPEDSLCQLTGLKKLVIVFEMQQQPVVIDEISVNLTFLRLSPRLHLTIKGYFWISETLAAKLTAHYQNIYLKPF